MVSMDTTQPGEGRGAEPSANSGEGPVGAAHKAAHDGENRRPDPTKMINQPALRESNGAIWIVMGGLFLAVSLIPYGALIFAGSGRSAPVATTFAVIIIALYIALVATRFAVSKRKWRLRIMAGCMLSMAGLALIGMWLCSLIENAQA